MDEITSSPTSPKSNARKRGAPSDEDNLGVKPINLKGTQFMMATPPDTEESSNASPILEIAGRVGSPAPSSISTLSSVDLSLTHEINATCNLNTQTLSSKQPPAKKRKLTPAEKTEIEHLKQLKRLEREVKQKEKAVKDQEKAEQKAKRDEDKRMKAEEREGKKREKELEEERKLQEKMKKERAQMRLGVFFQQKPTTPGKSPVRVGDEVHGLARRKSLSLEPYEAFADPQRTSVSPIKVTARPSEASPVPSKPTLSDYRRYFLPFEPPSHSAIAQLYAIPNPDDLACRQGLFDDDMQSPTYQEKGDLDIIHPKASFDQHFAAEPEATRGVPLLNLRDVVNRIQGSSQQPIDLTQDLQGQAPIQALQTISRRHLHFHEDVRPAYYGTYTKIRSPKTMKKLSRDPFSRSRKDTEYDYDSEAEWEEPEEGEELLGDDDDDTESFGDADEMDGFLDDEEDALKNKRKVVAIDLQPTSTGICWENESGKMIPIACAADSTQQAPSKDINGMRLGFLIPGFSGRSVDPLSTAYWQSEMPPPSISVADVQRSQRSPLLDRNSNSNISNQSLLVQEKGSEGGPVITLATALSGKRGDQSLIGAAQGEKGPITSVAAAQASKRGPKPQPKTMSKEDLEEFKQAVVDSPLGKLDLLKGLKARFPKITNELIKDTLGSFFAQIGVTKADKRWIYTGAA